MVAHGEGPGAQGVGGASGAIALVNSDVTEVVPEAWLEKRACRRQQGPAVTPAGRQSGDRAGECRAIRVIPLSRASG